MIITDIKQIIPGKRVRCLYPTIDRLGKLATIVSVSAPIHSFIVRWDDGCVDYTAGWYFEPGIFELIEEEKETSKACQNCGCHNKFEAKDCWFCHKNPF